MHLLFHLFGVVPAILLAKFGIALLRSDKTEAQKNASRTRSMRDAVMRRVQINSDWLPDARVQGGIVFNTKANRIEICGRISDESLDRTFR